MRARTSGPRSLDDISGNSIALTLLTYDDIVVMLASIPYTGFSGRGAMDFTGRSMRGFVFVESAGIRTKRSLASWVALAAAFAKSLPPKAGHARAKDGGVR